MEIRKIYKRGENTKNRSSITLDKRSIRKAKIIVSKYNLGTNNKITVKNLIESLIEETYKK